MERVRRWIAAEKTNISITAGPLTNDANNLFFGQDLTPEFFLINRPVFALLGRLVNFYAIT
jgi:hypothetical protein